MTRDELYALVWSKPVTEVGLLVGMSGNGLAKACRRHGVQVPPRGYWQRLEAGQVIQRAPPPENGHLETYVVVKDSRAPVKEDPTGAMLRRRVARAPASAVAVRESKHTADDVADECSRILQQGLRRHLLDAAGAYLTGVAEAIPTLDDSTAQAAGGWVKSARATLASTSPAEDAVEALRTRNRRHAGPEAWLGALIGGRAAPASSRANRKHKPVESVSRRQRLTDAVE